MNIRFGSVSMMAATAVAILGFNTLSLHVSAERAKVEKLERRIAADLRDIRGLEAELRTRARLPVLQTWNDNVLAMSAPTAKQFADSPVHLAAFAPGAPAVAPGVPAMQMAIATPETTVVSPPGLVKASYSMPAPAALPATVVIDMTGERAPAAKPAPAKPAEAKKAEPRKVDVKKVETKRPEAKPAAPVKLAEAKPKTAPRPARADDSLGDLIGAIDSAAAGPKASMQ